MTGRQVTDKATFEAMKTFLGENKLPNGDLKLTDNFFLAYYDNHGKMIGTGGLEFYSSYSLLRSIAVADEQRGKSLGKKIISDLTDEARRRDVKSLFLLTETAPVFFEKLGFKRVGREQVPEPVKASSEFALVCPVSAVCMRFDLKAGV